MFRRVLRVSGAVLVAGALVVAVAGTAGAGTIPRSGATPPPAAAAPAWGAPCPTIGADGYTPGGTHLVCQQRKGDDCPRWHSAAPAKHGTGWTRPSTPPCPCDTVPTPSSSPSASPSASPSVSASPSASPSVSTPVSPASSTAASASPVVVGVGGYANAGGGGELPVTGSPVARLVGIALLMLTAGVLLRVFHLVRRRRSSDRVA